MKDNLRDWPTALLIVFIGVLIGIKAHWPEFSQACDYVQNGLTIGGFIVARISPSKPQ